MFCRQYSRKVFKPRLLSVLMEWKEWNGKKVFVQLKTGAVYSGKIIDVDEKSPGIVFITLLDKFDMNVMFVVSEIIKIKEEGDENA